MVGSMADGEKRDEERERYERGLPDYHDPTSGWGGATPARSALTLRLVLAIFGFVLAVGFTIWALLIDAPTLYKILPAVGAVIAAISITVVARRTAGGEPVCPRGYAGASSPSSWRWNRIGVNFSGR